MAKPAIPDDVKRKVEEIVARYNQDTFGKKGEVFYEPHFQGKYCHLHRSEYGRSGPICRITWTGKMEDWDFAIFKWSSERYDPDEHWFPGSELVDGTVEGALRAGTEAYPASPANWNRLASAILDGLRGLVTPE